MTAPRKSVALCICGKLTCGIPFGYCHCRCGLLAPLAPRTKRPQKMIAGMPVQFICGHQGRKRIPSERALPFKIEGVYCRLIPLTLGYWTIVWESDYEYLMQWKWWANKGNRVKYYAVRKTYSEGVWTTIPMTDQIMGPPPKGKRWDHKSSVPMDNRRANLRDANCRENSANSRLSCRNTTGYKGVSRRKNGRYEAHIRVNGYLIYLGTFDTAELASAAYWEAVQEYFGEFARLA